MERSIEISKNSLMDSMKQPAIVVGYHYPCLDGIYSMMNTFLSLKLYNEFNSDLIDRLLNEDFRKTYREGVSAKKDVQESESTEIAILKERLTMHSEDLKGYV